MTEEQLREIEARFAESRRWTSGPHVDACCHDVPVLLAEVRRLQADAAIEAEAMASTLAGAEQDRREARAEIERLTKIAAAERALRLASERAWCESIGTGSADDFEASQRAETGAADALRVLGVTP